MRRHALASASLAAIAFAIPAMANDDVRQQTAKPEQWVLQTGDYANQRYSKLDQINRDNVKNLKVAWTFSTGVLRGHEGSPLVVGNIMYVHTPFPNIVYALDLSQDGKILWKYEPKQDPSVIPVMCCDTVYRGTAYADGTIYHHQADTTLVALDAKTGKEKWKVVNGDPKKGETNTATVLPVKDKVIVEFPGAEFGVRGHVTARRQDRQQVWRASRARQRDAVRSRQDHVARQAGRQGSVAQDLTGDQWKIGGGTAQGLVLLRSGNQPVLHGTANPDLNPVQRASDGQPIDQKWTMAIIARDADTGVARWNY
jgi:PQQ-dependent dehydrogenase (methanol/ethanol family)